MDQDCEQAAGCLASSAVWHVNEKEWKKARRVFEEVKEDEKISKEEKAHEISHQRMVQLFWLHFVLVLLPRGWGGYKMPLQLALYIHSDRR